MFHNNIEVNKGGNSQIYALQEKMVLSYANLYIKTFLQTKMVPPLTWNINESVDVNHTIMGCLNIKISSTYQTKTQVGKIHLIAGQCFKIQLTYIKNTQN